MGLGILNGTGGTSVWVHGGLRSMETPAVRAQGTLVVPGEAGSAGRGSLRCTRGVQGSLGVPEEAGGTRCGLLGVLREAGIPGSRWEVIGGGLLGGPVE